jgi:hypothetical protein
MAKGPRLSRAVAAEDLPPPLLRDIGLRRVRSHCRFALPFIRLIPNSLR